MLGSARIKGLQPPVAVVESWECMNVRVWLLSVPLRTCGFPDPARPSGTASASAPEITDRFQDSIGAPSDSASPQHVYYTPGIRMVAVAAGGRWADADVWQL